MGLPLRRLPVRAGIGVAVGLVVAALAPMHAAVRPPKLQSTLTTLPNGLRVIVSEDHSTPAVHVSVWYHVGSKNERPGRTGFAHLFEHMMFKGSKNVEPESHTSIIASIGGRSNAYTTEDETVFWQTLPAHYLPLALWLEADRMATLRIDEEAFRREREVVKEERRMRVENQPYGRLSEIIYGHAFTTHPYKHPTIGSMADLEAASIGDVRDFHQTYYVPENATITIVGDFDAAQAVQMVTQYFGRVPKATRPVPRDIPKEPEQTKERRAVVEEAWPLPAVVVAYHVTYDGHPDAYPLHITAKILSDGQSARIPLELMYKKRIALTAFGSGNITEDPNLFYAVAIVQPGQTPVAAERALIAEFDKLTKEPVLATELQRAKNQFARDYIVGRESNQDKALHLAHSAVIHNDIGTADGEFDIFTNVTTADVLRVARTYFTPNNRVVLHILPKAGGSR
ncbi:MAG TPA: pitrilysin family protein [Vicinamibacterales bacterium]|nr:pitrilysin family protein [Vicinamibacterales bacterium]